jgi:FkbM family methyltransferase
MKLNKLRKIFRIIFPKKENKTTLFEYQLKNIEFVKEFKFINNFFVIKFLNDKIAYVRDFNFSDIDVFLQIFKYKEYQVILDIFNLNYQKSRKMNIIDAGSNVGYTSLFFSFFLENYSIHSIEPSKENFEMCQKNFEDENIYLHNNALAEKSNMKYNIERDFRDKKDWSITTKNSKNGEIDGITVQEIISNNKLEYISLLKIDIEGAERFILNEHNNLNYLHITEIIAIEIHDEFNIRKSIEDLLVNKNFFLFNAGELTIGLNKSFFL